MEELTFFRQINAVTKEALISRKNFHEFLELFRRCHKTIMACRCNNFTNGVFQRFSS